MYIYNVTSFINLNHQFINDSDSVLYYFIISPNGLVFYTKLSSKKKYTNSLKINPHLFKGDYRLIQVVKNLNHLLWVFREI